jgi:hypothetical protein
MRDRADSKAVNRSRNNVILLPSWLAVCGLICTGLAGIFWWGDPPRVDAVNEDGILTLVHASTVTSLSVAVLTIPLLLKPGVLPWLLSGLLFVGAVAEVFGWQAARSTTFGVVQCVVAVLCVAGAITSLFAIPNRPNRGHAA